MTTTDVLTLIIALAGVVLGGLSLLIQWRSAEAQKPKVKLSLSTALPAGPIAATLPATLVTLTVANVGGRPVGVDGIGISLSDGRHTPGIYQMPYASDVPLAGVLQPGERSTMFWDHDGFQAELRESGIRIVGVYANLAGGEKKVETVDAHWKRFGA